MTGIKPRSVMSAATYAFVKEMREHGVFKALNPRRLRADQAEVVLTCFDMHRVHETVTYHRTLGGECRHCAHLSYPGGALILAPHSKLAVTKSGYRVDMPHLDALEMAAEELGVERFSAYVHFPCTAARLGGLTDREVLETHLAAKCCLHNRFPKIDVASLVHIDWTGYPEADRRQMETYKFDRREFGSHMQGTTAAVA